MNIFINGETIIINKYILLFSWLCSRPDGPKFLEVIVFSRLFAFMKKCLDEAELDGFTVKGAENNTQPGFIYKG